MKLIPLLLTGFLLCSGSALTAAPALRAKVVPAGQPTTAPNQPILVLPASGSVSATLVAEAFSFTPTSYTWSQVPYPDVLAQHMHAANALVGLSAATTSVPQVTATFPARGVYQLLLTASNGTTTVTAPVWIHVWDRLTGLNPLQQIGRNPGLTPPSAVRELSPDPGPYQHPRLLFTKDDWAELNAKSTASTQVVGALASLQSSLNNNFDRTAAPVGALRTYANALSAWADGGFSDSTYTASVEPVRVFSESGRLGADPQNKLSDALLVASYMVWVRNDPTQPLTSMTSTDQTRCRFLAKVAAAAARAELTRVRLNPALLLTGSPDMGVVYDVLYDWMTPAERTDLRDFLYATSYGYYNTGGGGIERGVNPTPADYRSNGDFPNLKDPYILPALAIEGEETSVTSSVVAAAVAIEAPATGPAAWPGASRASVWNLYRMNRWYSEYFLTPWGSPLNHHAYFEASSGMSAPAMLALARRGQNGFVTTNLYQVAFHTINNLNPESPTGKMVLWDHHDSMGFGNGIGGYAGSYIARYMYPDDALQDYVYPAFRNEVSVNFYTVLFHVDRPTRTLAEVATAKGMKLTELDPFRGAATTRNTWAEKDLSLYFECRPDVEGHMHAEANNFSLYALGRPWSTPPGYHAIINDVAATVLIRDPALASDPATEGYYGESASAATITPTRSQFPTPPGRFLEATEDPSGSWTLFAGDATAAYQYGFESGQTSQDTGRRRADFFYSDALSQMDESYDPDTDNATLMAANLAFNPVQYAFRTVFTARGARPYVLVVDDITVDGTTPRDYRWNMPACGRDAVNTLRLQAGATATDAVLYHQPDAASGPRLLVRDLSEQSSSGQPAILLDTRLNGDGKPQLDVGFDNNSGKYSTLQSNRLLITRQNVVSPKFKVLLFPHQSGETLPITSWNAANTIASIDLRNGFTDRITLDATRADKRTRVTGFTRTLSAHTAPTLTLPAAITAQASAATLAFTGQPGAQVNFTLAATSDTGATLTPAVSSPSGTVFPVGVNTVFVTATDALGQVTSGQFTVTVVPSAPSKVSVLSATNQPGFPGAIALRWSSVARATAYSVKRATSPGGPYTTVSDRQPASDLTFSEGGLTGSTYFYIVTSWFDQLEGVASPEVALTPTLDTLQAAVVGSGLTASGVHGGGSRYLLTAQNGSSSGGGSDSITYAYTPWTGDGSFTVRVSSLSAVSGSYSEFLNLGLSLRASTAGNAVSYLSGFTTYPNGSSFVQLARATAGQGAVSSAYAVPPNPQRVRPTFWLRAVRSGNTFSASFSSDGQSWSPTADPVTIANFPASFLAGVGLGASGATVTDAVFDQFVFLGTPVPSVQPSAISVTWSATPGLVCELRRATAINGPYQTLVSGPGITSYTDSAVTTGATYYYVVATPGTSAGGATTSAPVAGYYPVPVTAPTGLTLTPGVGQISLAWNPGSPASNPTYSVQRATSAAGPFTTIATGLTSAGYVDTGAGFVSGTAYFYRIVANNGLGAATSATTSANSLAGTFTKANNTTALDQGASWNSSVVPTTADTALWTGTYATGAVGIGSGLAVNQLRLASPSQAITLNAGTGPLTLGAGGLDLSTASQNLTVNAPVKLAASQPWTVASGRTFTFTGPVTASVGTPTLTLGGAGTFSYDGNGTTTPFSGPLVATGGIFRLNQPSAVATLNAANLPAGSVNTLTTVTGASGATLIVAAAPTAGLTFGTNTAGLNVTLKSGQATLTTNGGASNLRIEGGTFIASATDRFTLATPSQTFAVTGGTVDLTRATQYGFRFGCGGSASQTGVQNVTATQSGGTVLASFMSVGGTDTAAAKSPVYSLSGGTLNVGASLQIGADTTGNGTATFALSGGKILVPTTLSGSQAGARQIFSMTGGTLVAGTLNAANLRSTDPATNGTFTQSGGTLAPGDLGTAGKTVVTGNYTLGTNGTLAVDIGGTTQATGYQIGQYDYLTVSGATTLSGNLAINVRPGFTPAAGSTFTIVSGTGALSGAFANVPFNGTLANADGTTGFTVTKSGNTVVLSQYHVLAPPTITAQPQPVSAPYGSTAVFSVTASSSLSPVTYQWRKNGAPLPGQTGTTLTLPAITTASQGDYDVIVGNSDGSVTSASATLTYVAQPPAITAQPASVSAAYNASVDFTVTASGGPGAATYQWRKNTSPINGANSSTLSLTGITSADAGSYDVVITNMDGSVTSNAAVLTYVAKPPVIATQPASASAPYGGQAAFTVTAAAGTPPITYEWVKRTPQTASVGTSATLNFPSLTTADAGTYQVVLTNADGTVTSNTVSLTCGAQGPYLKADNTTVLSLAGSWTPVGVPTAIDPVQWNGTYANGAVGIGTGLSVERIQLTSPSTAITVNAGTGPLTLAAALGTGLDLSASTQNLTFNAPVVLDNTQTWSVNAGRTLTVNGAVGQSGGSRALTLTGNGTVVFSGNNTFSGGLSLSPLVGGVGGIARLTGGALPAPISANGRLEITGPLSSLGPISGTGANGIVVNSSTTSQNLTFTGGSSFSKFQVGADNARAVLRSSGAGNVTFTYFGYNTTTPNAQHTFDGGTWTLGQIGQNNTGAQTSGVFTLTNGADVTVTTQCRFTHGTWRVVNGALRFNTYVAAENGNTNYASLVFLVDGSGGGPGLLTCNGTLTLASGGSMSNVNSLTIGAGGTVTLESGLGLGSTTVRTAETDTVNLGGGKLSANGTIAAAAATAGQTRTFNWTDGQLTAAAITAGPGFATPVSGGISSTALVQTGGTLAPGDTGVAGKTVITGNYTLGGNGTLAMDIGGTTQATGYQTGQYDCLTVSGATTLSANLTLTLVNGFTPTNTTTFTVLTSTGPISGGFANVVSGQRLTTTGGEGSFVVTKNLNTVTLSQYEAAAPAAQRVASSVTKTHTDYAPSVANVASGPRPAIIGRESSLVVTKNLNSVTVQPFASSSVNLNTGSVPTYDYGVNAGYDYNNDGVADLIEYGLGVMPGSTVSATDPFVVVSGNPPRLALTFTRERPDVTYFVEASSDLVVWTVIATNPGTFGQSVTVTDPENLPTTHPPRRFLRLRVTSP